MRVLVPNKIRKSPGQGYGGDGGSAGERAFQNVGTLEAGVSSGHACLSPDSALSL